jgi:hypothetical protein
MDEPRRRAFLTLDLEDYRADMTYRHTGRTDGARPGEVEESLALLLDAVEQAGARATAFIVGEVARRLPGHVLRDLAARHQVGAHGDRHLAVADLGPRAFAEDLRANRCTVEDRTGVAVRAFRAPFFSVGSRQPWFGEILAREGFSLDSSRRLLSVPRGFTGSMPLEGSGGAVTEIPMAGIGYRSMGLSIVGGSWFRLLPLPAILALLASVERRGFVPMVYLHPYDVHPRAEALDFTGAARPGWMRGADMLRRVGRRSAAEKLAALSRYYEFGPIRLPAAENGGG